MLKISGFGPKKVKTVWEQMQIESVGELLYAVNENRLIELKGFGIKTQEDLKTKLAYFQLSKGQFLYATVEPSAKKILAHLEQTLGNCKVAFTGAIRRACPTLDKIELLVAGITPEELTEQFEGVAAVADKGVLKVELEGSIPLWIYCCQTEEWGSKQFRYTAAPAFMDAFLQAYSAIDFRGEAEEAAVFEKVGLAQLPAELMEEEWGLSLAQEGNIPELIEAKDVVGVIHSHTTYSDGIHNLEEMTSYAYEQGYKYIGITDHSKAAFYANGLSAERVLEQMKAIDKLNEGYTDFKIFKGIESDILADGSLDYEEDVLKLFDFTIASIHSNLRMDETKATARLLKAIENPYTSILGHPTGRLLLSRPGYPIDHRKIIDACAANGVAIELNASPYRLDLDWTWIPYALEKGVWISINPDAHSQQGIHDIYFGTFAARKGGLTKAQCLNALSAEDFFQRVHKW
ncbi:MAG: PHP domain-containing protein, partial [Bacteroidota bacterium]